MVKTAKTPGKGPGSQSLGQDKEQARGGNAAARNSRSNNRNSNANANRREQSTGDTTHAKRNMELKAAMDRAGGISTADVRFINNCTREARLKAMGQAEDYPRMVSLTDAEQKALKTQQVMLDAMLALPEDQQDANIIKEVSSKLDRLKEKSKAKGGEHESAKLHRILSELKTHWTKTRATLTKEVEEAEAALQAAKDRVSKAHDHLTRAEVQFKERQAKVGELLADAPPLSTGPVAATPDANLTVHVAQMAPMVAAILSKMMEDAHATGAWNTDEGQAKPELQGAQTFSKELVQRCQNLDTIQQLASNYMQANPSTQSNTTGTDISSTGEMSTIVNTSVWDTEWGDVPMSASEIPIAEGDEEGDNESEFPADW